MGEASTQIIGCASVFRGRMNYPMSTQTSLSDDVAIVRTHLEQKSNEELLYLIASGEPGQEHGAAFQAAVEILSSRFDGLPMVRASDLPLARRLDQVTGAMLALSIAAGNGRVQLCFPSTSRGLA